MKKKYQPTHNFELHLLSDDPSEMLIIGFADQLCVTDVTELNDEQLSVLLRMAMTAQDNFIKELFRRRPEIEVDFENFVKKQKTQDYEN